MRGAQLDRLSGHPRHASLTLGGLAALALVSASALAGPPRVGERFSVRIQDLPPPYATASVANGPRRIPLPPGTVPAVPEGFRADRFAAGLVHARWLAVAPDGAVMVAEPRAGRITRLVDGDGDGRAETRSIYASGFALPHGMAFHAGYLYVADTERVWRLPYRPGETRAASPAEPVTEAGVFGPPGGHWTRNLAFAPSGERFYVAVGSAANLAEEAPPRATVQVFAADGSAQRTFASGLRNPVGIAFRPGTDDPYVVVNERDGLGDRLVPDYLTRLREGAFYGWPYAYLGSHPQPGLADRRPDLVAGAVVPDLLFRAHSAPLGLVFYDGTMFPPAYRGDAFVALHGSWNAAEPQGYMVARVRFRDGRPVGSYEAFATGFWVSGGRRARVWGRPVGLAVAADGALLVADDVANVVWRIAAEP